MQRLLPPVYYPTILLSNYNPYRYIGSCQLYDESTVVNHNYD